MKPYSLDLRERVIAALEAGQQAQAAIAATFGVSPATLEIWWRRWRETRTVAPRAHGGGNPHVLAGCESFLRAVLTKQPDTTLDELCSLVWDAKGLKVSRSMMCRELQRLKLPRKKRRHTTVNGTPRG
jgi:transposase